MSAVDRPPGCPPWCVTDHASRIRSHVGTVRSWVVPLSLARFSVSGCLTKYDSEPKVMLVFDGSSHFVPVKNSAAFAGLLDGLGRAELAALVREVAAEIEGVTAHPTGKEATTS